MLCNKNKNWKSHGRVQEHHFNFGILCLWSGLRRPSTLLVHTNKERLSFWNLAHRRQLCAISYTEQTTCVNLKSAHCFVILQFSGSMFVLERNMSLFKLVYIHFFYLSTFVTTFRWVANYSQKGTLHIYICIVYYTQSYIYLYKITYNKYHRQNG